MIHPDPRGHVHTLGAFRGCDAHHREHGISYTAVMERTGPDAVGHILEIAERAGVHCASSDESSPHHEHCYATLDLRDVDGATLEDRCIPTRETFDWWTRAVELRPDSSDCPVDTPEAHAATYANVAGAGRHDEAAAILLALDHHVGR